MATKAKLFPSEFHFNILFSPVHLNVQFIKFSFIQISPKFLS
jgi:hypothetical protein